jgi:predicted Zn finger-like uncharacterized protein
MFTICPKCTLVLAVTTADLRTGQGYVRCGRCANVFNALLTLSEEPASRHDSVRDAAQLAEQRAPIAVPASDPIAAAAEHAPIAAPAAAAAALDETTTEPPASPEPAPDKPAASTEAGEQVKEFRSTGTFETIVLQGDTYSQTEEFVSEEDVNSEINAVRVQLAAANEPHHEGSAAATANGAAALDAPAAALIADLSEPPRPRSWRWLALASVLLLVLAAQAVHHWRNALAAQPTLNRPLTRLYAKFGVALTPDWDLHAYDVRQLGAVTDPAGGASILVRISVLNRALHAQPVPALRLTLLDRFGKRVAARDLKPEEYLPPALAGLGFLAPSQRIDADVHVVDPGPDAASFEVDVCLSGAGGALHCANDSPLAPPHS